MIKILIADDHTIVREGIVSLLGRERDLKVVGQAIDGEDAIAKILKTKPDVVIMDISMPKLNGIDAIELLLKEGCTSKFIILTQYEKPEYIRLAMRVGAAGYLVKDSITKDILDAIHAAARGEVFFSPSISHTIISDYVKKTRVHPAPGTDQQLTSREIEILQLIAEGLTSRQIGDQLFVSVRTVDFHRANIIQKLGIRDVAGLTRYAIKHGIAKI